MLVSSIRSASRLNRFTSLQFIRLHSVPSLAHFTPYFSDSGSEDPNSTSRNDVTATNCSDNDNYLELNPCKVVQILQNMKLEPISALSFFNNLKEKGFRHDARSYLAMIKILCYWRMDRKLDCLLSDIINLKGEDLCFEVSELLDAMAEELKSDGPSSLLRAFDTLIKTYASLEMFDEAIDTLFATRRHGVGPCVLSCNFLMNRLVVHGKVETAVAIYRQLKNIDVEPNIYTYGIAVKAYCRMGSLEEAAEVFLEMEEAGVLPNCFTYTAYLEGLCRHGHSDVAYEYLRALDAEAVPVDAYAYATVIQGFVSEKKMKDAEMLLLDMEEHRVVPNEFCYRTLIQGYCDSGDIVRAMAIHNEMVLKGIRTNCSILSSMFQCLRLKGMYSEAINQFINYKKLGIYLDEVTYNVAIDALCKLGNLDAAKILFDEMKNKKLIPDIVHYTTLINGHCLKGRNMLDAEHLFEEVKTSGLRADIIIYNVLAGGFSRKGHLDKVFSLLDTMKEQGLTPSSVTHNMIIEGLCIAQRVEEAETYLINLGEKSIENYSSMVNGCCKSGNAIKGFKLFCRFFSQGVLISRNSCAKLIESLCSEGENREAIRVLEIMLSTDNGPNRTMYIKLITALCSAGNMKMAQWAFDQMVGRGLTPDVVIYTIMMNGYCQRKLLQEAYALFGDMKKRHISPDIITHTVFIDGKCKWTLKMARSKKDLEGNKTVKHIASNFLLEMKDRKLKPDVICYTALIDSQCKSENLQEAVSLFNELIEQGLLPDTAAYTALISGYCKQGNVDKALTLMNEMKSNGIQPDNCTMVKLVQVLKDS